MRSALSLLTERLDDAVIFGGMVREFALGNTREFNSDIDIVTSSSSLEIANSIAEFEPKKNKFGGYRFVVGTQLFDVWSFHDTWAFKAGLVEGTDLEDILKTTFFNVDAAAYELRGQKVLCSDSYLSGLNNKLLDLNLEDNPAPSNMAKRAVRLAVVNSLQISPRLGDYILENVTLDANDALTSMYLRSLREFKRKFSDKHFLFAEQGPLFS